MFGVDVRIITVDEGRSLFPQGNDRLVVVVNGMLVGESLTCVNISIVRIDGEPRFGAAGKSRIWRIIPLHGCSGMIAARLPKVIQVLFSADMVGQYLCVPGVFEFDIIVF